MQREYDEDLGKWVPTYGKIKNEIDRNKNWMYEVKENYVPKGNIIHKISSVEGGDPFLDEQMNKKDRVEKQKQRELRNRKREVAIRKKASGLHTVCVGGSEIYKIIKV